MKLAYLAAIATVTFGMPLALQPVFAEADQSIKPVVCMEDEPCWKCSEMGNKVCGPQVIEGCHWDESRQNWVYQDNGMCRGTGEDPTADAAGNPACSKGVPVSSFRFGTTTYTCKEGV